MNGHLAQVVIGTAWYHLCVDSGSRVKKMAEVGPLRFHFKAESHHNNTISILAI